VDPGCRPTLSSLSLLSSRFFRQGKIMGYCLHREGADWNDWGVSGFVIPVGVLAFPRIAG
jgi:hypothetical protein